MEPRRRGLKRRLLAVTVTLALRDACSVVVSASASVPLTFSHDDAGWTRSTASASELSSSGSSSGILSASSLNASPPPSSSSQGSISGGSSSFPSSTHTEEATVASRTTPPGIQPWPAWLSAASDSTSQTPSPSAQDLVVEMDSKSQSQDGRDDSSTSFDAKGSAEAGDGSANEDGARRPGGPEDAPVISWTPTPSAADDGDANGGLESITATPAPDDTSSPPPPAHAQPSIRIPASPTPVGPFYPDEEEETPTPTPVLIDDDTESPPPPRSNLGNPPSPTSRTRPSTSKPPSSTQTTSPSPTNSNGNGGKSGSDAVDGGSRPTGSTPSTSSPSSSTLPSLEDRTMTSGLTPTIDSSSPQAPSPIIVKSTSTPEPSRRFQRGSDVIVIVQTSSGSGAPATKSIAISPSQSPALVLRGDQASSSNINSGSTTDSSSADVYAFVQYLTSIAALLSLLWLIISSLLVATASVSTPSWLLGDPNQWEFGVFVVHIQGLASFSHAIATSAMPAFALRYLDTFSWTVFLPFHGAAAGVGNSRRLDAVILDGIVAFADRVGVNEANLLSNCVAAFVVVLGVVGVVVGVSSFFTRSGQAQQMPPSSGNDGSIQRVSVTDPAVTRTNDLEESSKLLLWIAVGLFVLLWQFALYPLTLLGSYEISMELQSTGEVRSGPLALAVLVLALVCFGGLVGSAFKVWKLNSREKMAKPRNIAIWGSLYDGLRVQHRLFFLAFTVSQMFRGVVIGCVVNATVQLSLLLATDVVVLAAALRLRPFQPATLMKPFVVAVLSLRVVTTALTFAYTSSTASPPRHRISTALVIIHTTVQLLWFARHFGMACRQIRLLIASRHASTEKTSVTGRTPQEVGEHATPQAAAYASFDQRLQSSERRGPGAPYSSAWDDSM